METGIGGRLKARAKELHLNDAEVARRLGLAQSRYAHYVSGTREPDFQTFIRICRTLRTSPDRLLGFPVQDDEPPPEMARLRDRVAGAVDSLELPILRIAADILDVLVRQPEPEEPIAE
jgi:transcriptional regulator with XRE-family HTH domain